jgi:hypothetical protein
MVAFNNDPLLKRKCLELVTEYGFIKGINNEHLPRWHDTPGPYVYETELGLPEWLNLTDISIGWHLSADLSASWVFDYLSAVPVGADLSKVPIALNHWALTDPIHGEWRYFTNSNKSICSRLVSLYSRELYGPYVKLYSSEYHKFKREWFETWAVIKNPIYWVDSPLKRCHHNQLFDLYAEFPTKPLISNHSDWFDCGPFGSGIPGESKFIVAARECLLSLLKNSNAIA